MTSADDPHAADRLAPLPDTLHGFYRCAADGSLIAANTVFARLMGYDSVDSLLRRQVNLDRGWYIDPARRTALRVELADRGVALDREVEVHRLSRGDRVWVVEDVRRRPSADGRSFVVEGFVRDVGKRHAEEERLRKQAERLRAVTGLARVWYWETDAEHRFTYVSPSYEALTAGRREAHLGRRPWELAEPEDEAEWERHRQDIEARRPFAGFAHRRRIDGDWWELSSAGAPAYDADGRFLGYRGITAPRSEADRQPAPAADPGRWLAALVDSAHLGIYVHRGARLLMANAACARMFGYADPAAMLAELADVFDLATPEERPRLVEYARRRLSGLPVPGRYETRMRRADGSQLWLLCHALVVEWEGEPAMLHAVIDISVYKRAQMEMRAAIEQAEKASRAKSDFLAAMSHELRTPLNAIMGFAEVIAGELVGPLGTPVYGDYARDIHASGAHLLSLIGDLLDIAKIEAGRMELNEEQIAVPELVDEVVNLVRKQAEGKGVALAQQRAEGLPRLYADRRATRQMLLNLLSNAIKFTPGGGSVTVQVSADAAALRLQVNDTGVGVAPEELPKILAFFGQAENARTATQGTGLGLPITKSLIEQHGGRLDIETAKGRGMRVALIFPAERLRPAG